MSKQLAPHLKEKLDRLTDKPGVYLFKSKEGDIIYIGKAKVLKNRVRSYFHANIPYPKVRRMVTKIADLETIITDSEVEALILEANMVKEHRPYYNIDLKDDKSFPYIRITNEAFPRIFPTRRIIKDGSQYFGPFTDVTNMRNILKTVMKIFPIRSCKHPFTENAVKKGKYQVCLNYHIKRCYGPCENHISKQEYGELISSVTQFIQGKTRDLEAQIRDKMIKLSSELRFEEASRLRDQLQSIEMFKQRQKVLDPSLTDRDIVAIAQEKNDACAVVFKVREGKVIAKQHYYMSGTRDENDQDILYAFLQQYYVKTDTIPPEILIQLNLEEEQETIQNWLSKKREKSVKLIVPQKGPKAQLIKLCAKNARLLLDELLIQKQKKETSASVKLLQEALSLPIPPITIEGFDISNIQGTNPVASMVYFFNGSPKKSEYRHFKIQSKNSPDDFAMMFEAVTRRYSRLQNENRDFPDLILIDGGKGQLNAACSALEKLNIVNQPIIALAKRLDEVFVPGISDAQNIPKTNPGLKLLQQVRDESHRFAVTFHRKLRSKRTLTSVLEKIPGVAEKRRELLLKEFGSVQNIQNATLDQLKSVESIPEHLAEDIYFFFHPTKMKKI